jgi:MFS family permease
MHTLAGYTVFLFGLRGVFDFLPTFLRSAKAFSSELAGMSYGLLFVVSIVVTPFAGNLSDRFSRVVVATGALGLAALGLGIVVAGGTVPVVALGIVVFAAGATGFPPVIQAHLMDGFPAESRGSDMGLFKTVYVGVGSLGSTYVGYVAGQEGFAPAFAGLVVCFVASAAIIGWSLS